jgi:hypothetical protein
VPLAERVLAVDVGLAALGDDRCAGIAEDGVHAPSVRTAAVRKDIT